MNQDLQVELEFDATKVNVSGNQLWWSSGKLFGRVTNDFSMEESSGFVDHVMTINTNNNHQVTVINRQGPQNRDPYFYLMKLDNVEVPGQVVANVGGEE